MRGRFAPSPTGTFHLGNLRTALLAWLFARSEGSEFVLRFEDLDGSVRPEFYDVQRRDLERLGLDWDSELRQSEHLERYRSAVTQLVDAGLTYECFCTRREIREAALAPHGDLPDGAYPGTCRNLTDSQRRDHLDQGRLPAVRLATSGETVEFQDRQLGLVAARLDDAVLTRRDGTPAYNLVVVVDDAFQRIEEVVRADDLARSTPRQMDLGRHLGLPEMVYAHVPLVFGPEGTRLAKRDGAVTLDDRNAMGQSDTMVRAMLAASLGLAEPGSEATLADILARFDPASLPRDPWRLLPTDLTTTDLTH